MAQERNHRAMVLAVCRMRMVIRLSACASILCALQGGIVAEACAEHQTSARLPNGRERYESACAACHGSDGRGLPQTIVGFDTAIPDFTDCGFATPEPDLDWLAVMHDGGPARAFSRRMPAFGEVLTADELDGILGYVRGFCTERAWPRGELNLPRALVTEKAFPENEAVLTTTVDRTSGGSVANHFLYERRLGARSQFEIVVPLLLQKTSGGWQSGLGDVAAAIKHALFHSLRRGSILSVAGEIVLATGKENDGFGKGTTIAEPFVAFGQMLPSDGFLQGQFGVELPMSADGNRKEAFWRAALGKTFTHGRFGRAWSPMIELLGAKELEDGKTGHWDLLPQVQVTLSRRQHLMINAGVRVPLNERSGRRMQLMTYLLWDWFDGGLLEGWR